MSFILSKASRLPFERRLILPIAGALLLPNLAFVLISYAARSLPVEPIKGHLALALYRGDILTQTKDFVFLDSTRGVEPYGDADIMRMALYRGGSAWMDAIAPRLLAPADGVDRHPAELLHGAVFGDIAFNPSGGYYHRYWFGNIATTSFLLYAFDLRQTRLVVMNTSYLLFMLIPLLAARISSRMLTVMGFVGVFGILFSGLPYHGEAIGYAPAFIWSQIVVVITLLLWRRLADARFRIVLNLVLGAGAAYVEPMSGGFLMAAALLFLANFFMAPTALPRSHSFQRAALAVAMFLAGFLSSILFKQVLVFAVFGWGQTFGAFITELKWRMGLTGEKITIMKELKELGGNTIFLTFGSPLLAKLLCFGSLAALLGGAAMASVDVSLQRNRSSLWRDRCIEYSAFLTVIAMVGAWYVALPEHTFVHAWITVRLLYLPFCMSALLFYWSARNLYGDLRPGGVGASSLDAAAIAAPVREPASREALQPPAQRPTYSMQHLQEASAILSQIDPAACERFVQHLAAVRDRGGRLFILGVGGSAANASHAVNDFRKIAGIECYAPTDNVSELTARTNDEGWPSVFSEWLRCSRICDRDGILVLSVGGGDLKRNVSPNLVQAIVLAKDAGAAVLALVGRDGGYAGRTADAAIVVPTVNSQNVTPHAEAFQSVLWHLFVSHPALKMNPTKWEAAAGSVADRAAVRRK